MLALDGGKPVIDYNFKSYNPIGKEERNAAVRVIESGILSDFLGKDHEKFYGGINVKNLEKKWSQFFQVKDSVTFNSGTSALSAAIGACKIGPGDEVIVSPYTMAASATSILTFNGIPVFADINDRTYNITPETIKEKITDQTKAILVPSIIGHPARLDEIVNIAREYGIFVIEDACQAPTATLKGKYVGTYGDIGVFSLNKHKHIHTGEGGVAVTNNPDLAFHLRLIRNHGEVTADSRKFKNLVNAFGFNLRLGEIESAIGIEQLKKLPLLVENRVKIVDYMTSKLKEFDEYFETPFIEEDATHVYYLYAMRYKRSGSMPHRNKFVEYIRSEGLPVRPGFQRPLYLLEMFQNKIAYGEKGCPFRCPLYEGSVSYNKGLCPTTEHVENYEMITFHIEHYDLTVKDVDKIHEVFNKVLNYIGT